MKGHCALPSGSIVLEKKRANFKVAIMVQKQRNSQQDSRLRPEANWY
jgi:hypothetical protein